MDRERSGDSGIEGANKQKAVQRGPAVHRLHWYGKLCVAEQALSDHLSGNLPYTANSETVSAHFAKIKPKSVRHLTKKGENKSKGFAFLEFEAYDRMRTCLKLYHHSMFDDGKSAPRRINVELTYVCSPFHSHFRSVANYASYSAGGGGAKSDNRREKLKQKNQKLNEERKRRAIEEEKAKEKANLRAAKKTAREKRKQHKLEGNSPQISTSASVPEMASCQDDIHPSRRAQMMNT